MELLASQSLKQVHGVNYIPAWQLVSQFLQKAEKILLAGGGVGVAPLFLAGKVLKIKGMDVEFLLGYRSNQIIDFDEIQLLAVFILHTEDGSFGTHGLLTVHGALQDGDFDRIYCCGPDPMMKAVARMAKEKEYIL